MLVEQQFKEKMYSRTKTDLLQKHFYANTQWLDVPIFTDFSGKKEIVPFRNTQCLKPSCVYDIEELVQMYKNSGFQNYLNFICHTCRKMIDLQYFYRDITLQRMINKIWEQYNHENHVICSKVSIFRNGEWEPVLPEYIKRLHHQQTQKKDVTQDTSAHLREPYQKIQLQEYQDFPMVDDFTTDSYKVLLASFVNEDNPRYEPDIILNYRTSRIKWGEFLHFRSQASMQVQVMVFILKYLEEYFKRKRQSIGVITKETAFIAINVSDFDNYMLKARFHFLCDNLPEFGDRMLQFDVGIMVVKYDERWVCYVISLREDKFKVVDFMDSAISRSSEDEIYNLGAYLIKEIFPTSQMEKRKGEVNDDVRRKVNYYSDCGHHVAFYVYSYVEQELYQMTEQKKWGDQAGEIYGRLQLVKMKPEEKELFTSKMCWCIMSLSKQEPLNITYYKPPQQEDDDEARRAESADKLEDTIDKALRQKSQLGKAQKMWDLARNDGNMLKTSKKLGQVVEDKQAKEKKRAQRYWNVSEYKQLGGNQELPPQKPQYPQQQQMQLSPQGQSHQQQILSPQGLSSKQQQQMLSPQSIQGRQMGDLPSPIGQRDQVKVGGNQDKKAFFSIGKQELAMYLDKYRKQIKDDYRKQVIYKQVLSQDQQQFDYQVQEYLNSLKQEQMKQQVLQHKSPASQSQQSILPNNADIYLSQSQFKNFYKAFDPSISFDDKIKDRDIIRMQQELGIDEDDLANMDIHEFEQMLDLMGNQRFTDKRKPKIESSHQSGDQSQSEEQSQDQSQREQLSNMSKSVQENQSNILNQLSKQSNGNKTNNNNSNNNNTPSQAQNRSKHKSQAPSNQ